MYIGRTRSTRFRWTDVVEVPRAAPFRTDEGELVDPDNIMKRIMQEKQSVTSSVVLNYDILRELLNIDYERAVPDETTQSSPETEEMEF